MQHQDNVGIDRIIKENQLRFDIIYISAKGRANVSVRSEI